MKPRIIRRTLIRMLKASGKQFYDEYGNGISTEEYVDLLLKQDLKDALKYQQDVKKQKEIEDGKHKEDKTTKEEKKNIL